MIVDASVLFKLLVEEEGSATAHALFKAQVLSAPDMIFAEVANAIWSKMKRGEASIASDMIANLPRLLADVAPSADLYERALAMALEIGHPVYDCLYLALSLDRDEPLITADERFLRALERSPYGQKVMNLEDWGEQAG